MILRQLVSTNLKSARLRAGLSQSQLAERVGKSVRYISALENQAQNVALETLEALASGLGVSVSELVSDGADVIPSQVKKAKAGFDQAIALLNEYRTTMERQIAPPMRARKS